VKVIRVEGCANGTACPIAGQYVVSFDFEAYGGVGSGTFTADKRKAMQFADAGEALVFWRTVSRRYPVRADGQPNRPFTATTVSIEEAP
jgi:hypothetical protein